MRADPVAGTPAAQAAGAPPPGSEAARVLGLLSPDEPQHIERLIARSGVDAARATVILTGLELEGQARQLEGQRWIAAATPVRRG